MTDDPTYITEADVAEDVPEFSLGQLVWARINAGRGLKLVQLLSRHDPESWDCDLYPGTTSFPQHPVVIPEDNLLHYNPDDEPQEVEL